MDGDALLDLLLGAAKGVLEAEEAGVVEMGSLAGKSLELLSIERVRQAPPRFFEEQAYPPLLQRHGGAKIGGLVALLALGPGRLLVREAKLGKSGFQGGQLARFELGQLAREFFAQGDLREELRARLARAVLQHAQRVERREVERALIAGDELGDAQERLGNGTCDESCYAVRAGHRRKIGADRCN